jgi:prepilin-type N-terminal cleavage/methylation domain-containing protein
MMVRTGPLARGTWYVVCGPRWGNPWTTEHGLCTRRQRGGFTLIELLVVIFIILLVSAVALPTVLPAINHRQVSEAGRILQGALAGARDKAIHDNQPCGIRLLPDPAFPITWTNTTNTVNPYQILAYDRVVPIESAPEYSEGYCTPVPAAAGGYFAQGLPYPIIQHQVSITWNLNAATVASTPPELLLVESPVSTSSTTPGAPNAPTSWFWNIRVGDKIQINGAGAWYTVVGPMVIPPYGANIGGTFYANTDMFVNAGPPTTIGNQNVPQITTTVTTAAGTATSTQPVEYLFLVNGQDDNNNGWVDEGFDGVDNNGNAQIDEYAEWETEAWQGALANGGVANVTYTIQRRPAVAPNAREIALPTQMVIDATSLLLPQQERSRVPLDIQTQYSGMIDIIVNPDGTVLPAVGYSSPSSFRMSSAFYHLWLAERQDLNATQPGASATTTNYVAASWSGTSPYTLPIAQPGGSYTSNWGGPYLRGESAVLSLNARTGQISVNANPPFFYDPVLGYTNSPGTNAVYNATYPFIQAEQGVYGGP